MSRSQIRSPSPVGAAARAGAAALRPAAARATLDLLDTVCRADRRGVLAHRLQHGLVDLARLGVEWYCATSRGADHDSCRAAREEVLAVLLDRPREVAVVRCPFSAAVPLLAGGTCRWRRSSREHVPHVRDNAVSPGGIGDGEVRGRGGDGGGGGGGGVADASWPRPSPPPGRRWPPPGRRRRTAPPSGRRRTRSTWPPRACSSRRRRAGAGPGDALVVGVQAHVRQLHRIGVAIVHVHDAQ